MLKIWYNSSGKENREVNHIDKVLSYSLENVSVILVYLEENMKTNKREKVVDDVEKAVGEVIDLPENVETPVFQEITSKKRRPSILRSLLLEHTPVEYKMLRQAAKDLRDKLLFVDGVAKVKKRLS
jgi:multidrug efflux pump subunit AcrB